MTAAALDASRAAIDAALAYRPPARVEAVNDAEPRDDTRTPAEAKAAALRCAQALLAPRERRDVPAYPTEALGPLAEACRFIAEEGQVEAAMAGQCLLGAASLVTQGLHNVETLAGRRPLALNLLTQGDSGDGKSTAQNVALRAVHERQRAQAREFEAAQRAHEQALATRKRSEDPPEAPASPYRLIRDATVEGLRRDLHTGPCSQGVFTDEAAAILSGYGMTAESRAKTAGVFSGLWDSGHLSVSRATGGRTERYGTRVALHWLIQPAAASETLGDPLLSSLGFWPRFLSAWPEPQAPRVYRPFRPETSDAIRAYWRRCDDLLAMPLPTDADTSPVLPLDDDARALLGKAFERFEVQGRRGELRSIKPFTLRATEQACRVAGVLAAFAGDPQVTIEHARDGLALVSYSLETWLAIIDGGEADHGATHALRLYGWLLDRPGWCERLATIVKDGPACVRTRQKRDAALDLLREFGLVDVADGTAQALEAQP